MVRLNHTSYPGIYYLQWQLGPPDDIRVLEDQNFILLGQYLNPNIDYINDFSFVELKAGRRAERLWKA